MKTRTFTLATAAIAAALLAGCNAGPDYHRPATNTGVQFTTAQPTSRPASTQAVSLQRFQPEQLARWWESLNDPELDSLLERATAANLDLEIAVTRLQQARAIEAIYYGADLPSLNFSAVLGQGTGSSVTRGGQVDGPLNDATNASGLREITHALGVDTSFEIDLFGHLRREEQAVSADAAAASEFHNQVLVTLLGEVARTYVQVRTLQLRVNLAVEAIHAQQQSAGVAQERFNRGITNELDVALADREVETTQSTLAPLRAALLRAQRHLSVLMGQSPDALLHELNGSAPLPKPPAEINPGLPGDLLRRRPDIRQAEAQLIAANARLGVATAHLYPRIWLSAAVGEEGQGLGREPVAWRNIWEAAPSLSVPLLDFGQTDAVIQSQNQATRGAVAHYQLTVLQAVEEVDNALTDYDAERSRLDSLRRAVADGQRAYDLAKERYERGIVDFLNVLDAERALYALQDQYAVSENASVADFVNVCQSLGGGWEGFAPPRPLEAPLPALLAGFRDATGHRNLP